MSKRRSFSTTALVIDLARPYRVRLLVILGAMLVETVAALATPWPLKIVIDYAIGHRVLPASVASVVGPGIASNPTAIAAAAAAAIVILAVIGGIASYVDNYCTESVAQWVGNDLRLRIY